MDYQRIFAQAIDRLHAEGRYRVFIDILRNKGAFPDARCFAGHNGPKPIIVWCSNDYLAMGQHPDVVDAMEAALHDVGAGSGGTRNIGGNTHYHVELEAELADLHGKEAGLLFTSGYISNEATLSNAISFGAAGSAAASSSSRWTRSLWRNTFFSQPELRMPAIIEAWLSASEKMMQPGSNLATVESVASFEI